MVLTSCIDAGRVFPLHGQYFLQDSTLTSLLPWIAKRRPKTMAVREMLLVISVLLELRLTSNGKTQTVLTHQQVATVDNTVVFRIIDARRLFH